MWTRALSVVGMTWAVSLFSSPLMALEFPLPPPGEDIIGQVQVIEAKYEDTFADLDDTYDLGYNAMVAANPGVDAWLPGAGTKIVLPTRFILPPGPREGIVINLAEYRLYYFPKDGHTVFTYPIGIGREGWGSPVTTTKITGKIKDPSWYPPASIRAEHAAEGDILPTVVPPGPDNPLGPYKLTLGLPGYLIHGSNQNFGIGMQVSHGCIHLLNKDVTELVGMVPVGTPVRFINEPYEFGVSGGKLYIQAHQPLSTKTGQPAVIDQKTALVNALIQRTDLGPNAQVDWTRIDEAVKTLSGVPVEIATLSQPGVQTSQVTTATSTTY